MKKNVLLFIVLISSCYIVQSQNNWATTKKEQVKSISIYDVVIKDSRKKIIQKETLYLVEYSKVYGNGNLIKWLNPANSRSELSSVIDTEKRYFLHPPRVISNQYLLNELNFFPQFNKNHKDNQIEHIWENFVPIDYLKADLKDLAKDNPNGIHLKFSYFIEKQKSTLLNNNDILYNVCSEPTKGSHKKSGDFKGVYSQKIGFTKMTFYHFDTSEINFVLKSKLTVDEFETYYKNYGYKTMSFQEIIHVLNLK